MRGRSLLLTVDSLSTGTATGAGVGSGTATGLRIVLAAAAGSGAGTGTATGTIVGTVTGIASGAGAGTGSATGLRIVLASASGAGIGAGSAIGTIPAIVTGTAAGAGVGSGTATGTQFHPPVTGTAAGAGVGAGHAFALTTAVGGFGPVATTPFPAGAPTVLSTLPEFAFQLIEDDGTHVGWLQWAQGQRWRRAHGDAGQGTVVVQRDDPIRPEIRFPRRVACWLRSRWVHTLLIGQQDHVSVAQGEEGEEKSSFEARGSRTVLDRFLVWPLRENQRPEQDTRHWNFGEPNFPDDDWVSAVDVSAPTEPGVDGPTIPDGWLGPGLPIWGPSGTPEFAPGGRCYFRRSITIPAYEATQLHWVADNKGIAVLDGAVLEELLDNDATNYRRTHVIDIGPLDAGTHTLAFRVFNEAGEEPDPEDPLNPGYLRYALYELDNQGNPSNLIVSSGPATVTMEYPDEPFGWTPAQVLHRILNENELRTGKAIGRGNWNSFLDSNHVAWPTYEELSTPIGMTVDELVEQWSELYWDATMVAYEDTLYLFNHGTRGSTTGIDLFSGYTSTTTGCLTSAQHRTTPPIATSLLARSNDRWVTREVAATVPVEKMISLQQTRSATQTELILDTLLDIFGRTRSELSITLHPRIDEQFPWDPTGWHDADWVNARNRNGTIEAMRVQAVTVALDEHGTVLYGAELGDRVADLDERFQAWLNSQTGGAALRGHSKVPMPRLSDLTAPSKKATAVEYPFHRTADTVDDTSDAWPVASDGMLFELEVKLGAVQGSDVDVTLNLNGTAVATATVTAGATRATATGLNTAIIRGSDELTVTCFDLGFSVVAVARAV